MCVAVPATSAGVVHGAVRISYPTTELDTRVLGFDLADAGGGYPGDRAAGVPDGP